MIGPIFYLRNGSYSPMKKMTKSELSRVLNVNSVTGGNWAGYNAANTTSHDTTC